MKNSAIQWTDHTFNAWEGCTKVAAECKNCYAETLVAKRFGRVKWGRNQPRRRTSASLWRGPLLWNSDPLATKYVQRVFCLSLGDWLDEEVPIEWLADLLALIHATPNLEWQLLTKRPQNWRERLWAAALWQRDHNPVKQSVLSFMADWVMFQKAPPNVWIGVSAGANRRSALDIPAKIHFLSCEPMLEPLEPISLANQEFDWIIFGGESGPSARPCNVNWIRAGIEFCRHHNIAPFVKQLGANIIDPAVVTPPGKLKDSHGGDWDEWPEDLRVREFPTLKLQEVAA